MYKVIASLILNLDFIELSLNALKLIVNHDCEKYSIIIFWNEGKGDCR